MAVLAFLCEAFQGVKPSVAMSRHFYSMRISTSSHRTGCVSFRNKAQFIPMDWS
jgi:hypothetical protein